MFNIDFVAFILLLGIDILAVIGIVIYLASTYNWEKHNPIEAEAEADFNDLREKLANKPGNYFGD